MARRKLGLGRHKTVLKNEESSIYLNLFNEILLNFDKVDLKQRTIKNLGFIDQIFRILGYCDGNYFGANIKKKSMIKGQYFSNQILFDEGEKVERNSFLKLDLILKCLIFLIFTAIKNLDIQFYIRQKIKENIKMIFRLIYGTNVSMIKYFLTLLIKIYSENLTLLVKIPQKRPRIDREFGQAILP